MEKNKELILNKNDKRILKKYLKYYAERLEAMPNYYKLSEDFIDNTDDEYKIYHMGMSWIIEQMQHELSFIKTIREQQEIDKRRDLIKDRVINN
jgi:hypothetical protein